jgi:hypothetical protein
LLQILNKFSIQIFIMGFLDWLGNVGRNIWGGIKQVGSTLGTGIDWIHQNITTPVANFMRNVPVVGDVVQAADPILSLAGKIGPAMQGKGGLGFDDVVRAAAAVPGTIAAGRGAVAKGQSYANQARALKAKVF